MTGVCLVKEKFKGAGQSIADRLVKIDYMIKY